MWGVGMNEIISMIISLIGGLGLFLYGMKLMGDGLENASGEKLKSFFEKITSSPIKGILTGTIVTAIIQSSSATTVMVVGFVNAGIMTLYQAAGVIIGANIGTTITAQLVAFKLTALAPIFVGIGAAIVLFAEGKKRREVGNIILGFGILFMGMAFMSSAMSPLKKSAEFQSIMAIVGNNWVLGILVGLGMTAVVQSSSATTGILIALAQAGAIQMNVAVPVLFGNNIGTCVTALLSSIGTNRTAKKAAFVHLLFNIIGTLIFIPFMGVLTSIVANMSPGDIPRQIANAHTIFNITNTIVIAPFIKYLVMAVNKMIPGDDEVEKMGPIYLDDRLMETPVIAVGQTVKEVIRMANKAKKNLKLSMEAFNNNDNKLVNKVYENEKLINLLEDEITLFLVKLSNSDLSETQKNIVTSMFHVVNDIERVGDHAENIADLASEKIVKNIHFSGEANKELTHIFNYTENALTISIESFENNDIRKAESIVQIEERIDNLEKELRKSHIKRLNNGLCNAHSGAIFLDVISNFERIGDHATNIAESVINR